MSTEMWKLEKDLCRCCHAEGSFKNLSEPSFQLGQEEIYADMLHECLDVTIVPMTGSLGDVTYTICDSCVARLRDATNFKKQVLDCEERFKDMYSRNLIRGFEVKDEPILLSDSEDVKEEFHSMDDDDDAFLKFDDGEDDLPESDQSVAAEPPKSKGKGKAKPKPKPKAKAGKKTRGKKTIKEETNEDITEAAVSGEKKKGDTAPLRCRDYRKDGAYLCNQCDKKYARFNKLRLHIQREHDHILPFKCGICSKGFTTEAPFVTHKLEQHGVDDRSKCNACKKFFSSKKILHNHMNSYHKLGTRYKCEFCEFETYGFSSIYKHKFKHRTVKEFQCEHCKKAFLRKGTLRLHEKIHTGVKNQVCSECGVAFLQKASLNFHMTRKHPQVHI